jgi:hypothetical protein
MPDFNFIDQTNSHHSFQVAWESTLKCNLDCSYCGDGHDNTQDHPSLETSLKTVDFIIEYLNLYMSARPTHMRFATLNIQGGESIFHPHILEILKYLEQKKSVYKDWKLSIGLITNGITSLTRWKKICQYVDYFSMSFHSESLDKQQKMFRRNVEYLVEQNKNYHVAVLMHPKFWDICIDQIQWCKNNNVKYHPRQLDHGFFDLRFNYNSEQTEFLTGIKKIPITTKVISFFKKGVDLSAQGRACCGGEILCTSNEQSTKYIKGNNFKGWYCSVNKFFLYIKQTTGEIYTNKDCKMNLEGRQGVIGYLNNSDEVLSNLKHNLANNTLPTIVCKKSSCWCGLCSPKAADIETYNTIMKKYTI